LRSLVFGVSIFRREYFSSVGWLRLGQKIDLSQSSVICWNYIRNIKMDETLELVCNALEELAISISSSEKRPLVEVQGWHNPSISLEELSNIPRYLAKEIREAGIQEIISEELKASLESVPHKLHLTQVHTIPQILGANSHQAIPAYMATIEWISIQIRPLLLWQSMQDPKAMPPNLLHKLASMKRQVDEISINKDELSSQIKLIQDAKETAELLPANLLSLRDAQTTIAERLLKSESDSKKVSEIASDSLINEKVINDKISQAEKLINQCEEAYRVTTSKGLAGAFEVRANRLSMSMWVWVIGLLGALSIGAYIGADRLKLLTAAMSAANPDVGIIVMQSFLSVLSLGAPLWFAWLATKQIGQRFRLSEDYAFKASVAKAYEGYRKEAARIDPAFEARLFSTALTRVEEPPLRLVEENSHGSPWHELISSPEFQKAMNNMPELKDKFIEVVKEGMGTIKDIAVSQKNKDAASSMDEA